MNQSIMKKARYPTKLELEIKSRFGKSQNIYQDSLNTQQESKEDFKKKIFEKDEEIYDKINTKIE